jgi:hypothetical protein
LVNWEVTLNIPLGDVQMWTLMVMRSDWYGCERMFLEIIRGEGD